MHGFNTSLVKDKKRLFIPDGFSVGHYVVKDEKHAKKEGHVHIEYRFMIGIFKKHEPKVLVLRNF
jgi:hypothetical protein